MLPPYSVGQNLRFLRFFAGLNQGQMAGVLQVSQGWVSKLENGDGELTVTDLIRLRSHFEISSDALMDGTVDYLDISRRFSGKSRIPTSYVNRPTTRIRLIRGVVRLMCDELGIEAVEQVFRRLRVPQEILAEPRMKLDIRFLFTLLSESIQKGAFRGKESWEKIFDYLIEGGLLKKETSLQATAAKPGAFDSLLLVQSLMQELTEALEFKVERLESRAATVQIDEFFRGTALKKRKVDLRPVVDQFYEVALTKLPRAVGGGAMSVSPVQNRRRQQERLYVSWA